MDYRIFIITFILFFRGFADLMGQDDKASLILDLKKARITYEIAKDKFINDSRLLDEKAISKMEFAKSKNELLSAEVEYQKLMLRLIGEQSHIIVQRAVKYQTSKGDKRVRVTIKSAIEGNQDYLSQFKEHIDLFTPEMASGKTYNIFVSLLNLDDQTIIGSPYEIRIPLLEFGKSTNIDFALLKDVEKLQVHLNYSNKNDEKNILLEKDGSTNFIDIKSTQFSQEIDLGTHTSYDLILERFSSSTDIFKLMVVNLPKEISYSFEDNETGARLSNLKFNQGVNLRKLSLKVYLPERVNQNIILDKSINFYAIIVVDNNSELFEKDPYKTFTEQELNSIQGGKIRMELIPRGVGRLEVSTKSLYREITIGDKISLVATIKNFGNRRVDDIKVEMENPLNWICNIEPKYIESLNPEQEEIVKIEIIPHDDVSVGAQELVIKTEAYANNKMVETKDKTLRVQINARPKVLVTILLILLAIGLISGAIYYVLKISKH